VTAAGEPTGSGRDPRDRRLSEDDLEAYLRLRETSFGFAGGRTEETLAAFRARLPRSLGTFVGGELASVVTLHTFRVWVAGREVTAGGYGAIATAPEHRRAGHAARLMRAGLEASRDGGLAWNLLYPFDPAFYGRYGWVTVPTTVPLELPPEHLPAAAPGRISRRDGPATECLGPAYARFAATRSFADTRTVAPWDPWEDLEPEDGERLLRYAGDDAFVALRLRDAEGRVRLDVLDLGWVDAGGRDAVWGLLAAFRGHVERIRVEVPWDDPLAADRQRRQVATGGAPLMVRVADAPTALGPLRAVTDDDAPLDLPPVTVRIVDPYAPWNDGVWRIAPSPSGTAVSRSDAAPTATVDVRGLALLLAGTAAPADLRRVGWAEGDGRVLAGLAALSGGRRPYRSRIDTF